MSRQRRVITLILLLSLLVSLFAGCAATSKSTVSQGNRDDGVYPMETTAAGAQAPEMYDKGSINAVEPGSGSGSVQNTQRKIVRNASLGIEVVDVAAAYDQLLAYAEARKGYETMRNESRSQDFLVLYATIRIDPAELDNFIAYAETVGELINCQISTDDITEGYYDATTRLDTMEKSLARYDAFMERAQTIEEVLQVQNQINQITAEIESLKGRLRLWDSLLAESTISLEIRQVDDPVQVKKDITWSAMSWADVVYLIRSGLTRFANGFVNVVQWLFIALVITAPVLIILLVVLLILRRRRAKKVRALTKSNESQPPAPKPPETGI